MTNRIISLFLIIAIFTLSIIKIDYELVVFATSTRKPTLVVPQNLNKTDIEPNEEPTEKKIELNKIKIILTNYYVGDRSGSSGKTSSGLSAKDFGINNLGWYTYKGMVVMATATNLCLRVKSGACGKYNVLPDNYQIYDLFDTIDFLYKGKIYHGVVLDSCGACMRINKNEQHQRFDIFIKDKSSSFGKIFSEIISDKR